MAGRLGRGVGVVLVAFIAVVGAVAAGVVPSAAAGRELTVGSLAYPTFASAMAAAAPGDTIRVRGTITGVQVVTKSNITIAGPGTLTATAGRTLSSSGTVGVTVRDLTIRGKKGVYLEAVRGWRLSRVTVSATDECVRLRAGSVQNVVELSQIGPCGPGTTGTNGEGVYLGTSSTQTTTADRTDNNVVRGNTFRGTTTECVDIKEGAAGNLVEANDCAGTRERDTGGISVRGVGTIVRGNRSASNLGAGVRVGGNTADAGAGTVIVANDIRFNTGPDLNVTAPRPLGQVCGNRAGDASGIRLDVVTARCP